MLCKEKNPEIRKEENTMEIKNVNPGENCYFVFLESRGNGSAMFVDDRTYLDEDGIPHVRPVGTNKTDRQAIVCPYCYGIHYHELQPGLTEAGCGANGLKSVFADKGYYIDWTEEDYHQFSYAFLVSMPEKKNKAIFSKKNIKKGRAIHLTNETLNAAEDENLKQNLDSILHDTDQEELSEINTNLMQKLLTSSKERHHLELEDDDEFSQEYDTSLFEEI